MIYTNETTLYIFTLGDNESRSIRVILPTPTSTSQLDKYQLPVKLSRGSSSPPVQHRGNLHWDSSQLRITDSQDILVFDTEAESFRWMHGPAWACCSPKLFDMNGTLAVCSKPPQQCPTTTLDVWVVQDYEAETWVFKCQIDVSTVEASRPLDFTSLEKEKKKRQHNPNDSVVEDLSEMVVPNECELLVQFNFRYVLRCDIDSKFLGMLRIGTRQYSLGLTSYRLQETIAPIPSLGMQEEDVEPASSTGHA